MADSSTIREPLRVIMFKSLMTSLLLRHTELLRESPPSAASPSALSADRCYFEQQWNADLDRLEAVQGGKKLSLMDMTKLLEEIAKLTSAHSVERVKCLRPLNKIGETSTLPILVTCCGATNEGMRLLTALRQLCRMSCWSLISGSMREERGKNPPLAEQLRKKLYPE